jgi:hypothetical protein
MSLFGLLQLFAILAIAVWVLSLLIPQEFEGSAVAITKATSARVWEEFMDGEKHAVSGGMRRGYESQDSTTGFPVWIETISNDWLLVTTQSGILESKLVRSIHGNRLPLRILWTIELSPMHDRIELKGRYHVRFERFCWLGVVFFLCNLGHRSLERYLLEVAESASLPREQ